MNEVIRPNVPGPFGTEPDARSVIQPQSSLLRLFLRHFQAFTAPEPLNTFVIHAPTFSSKQLGDAAIAVAAELCCKVDDELQESRLVIRSLRFSPLRGTWLVQHAAGAPLGDSELLLDVFYSPSATGRA